MIPDDSMECLSCTSDEQSRQLSLDELGGLTDLSRALWTCGNLTAEEHTHPVAESGLSWCQSALGLTGFSHKRRGPLDSLLGGPSHQRRQRTQVEHSSVCVWEGLGRVSSFPQLSDSVPCLAGVSQILRLFSEFMDELSWS